MKALHSPMLSGRSEIVSTLPASRPVPGLEGFEHKFATVDGLRLHYVTGGNPQGDVVVLLAGFPQSWFAWRNVMALLAKTYRIVAPDLPGQGDSDRPMDGYDTQTLASHVHGLLQQLGVTRYFLAGHDVGAWVAFPYAVMFADEVRRLALLDAGIPGRDVARCVADFTRACMAYLAFCVSRPT
ncbi:pimeloyl-ACP methyl ester carboxylesterase [Paraburkholderia youngii]